MGHPTRDAGDSATLVSVAQAAALLGVHPNTLRTWTEAGRLTAFRINSRGDRRYRRADVTRLLVQHEALHAGEPSPEAAHRETEHRETELAVMTRLAAGLAGAAGSGQVCRAGVEALHAQLGVARVAAYLARDNGARLLHLDAHAGYRTPPPATLRSLAGDGAAPPDEVDRSPRQTRLWMRAGGQVLGVILLDDDPGGPLPGLRPAFLRSVAAALAGGVLSARRLARARLEVTRARALRHVTKEMTGQLDLATVLADIVDRTRTLFNADRAGLWLVADGDRPFVEAASRDLSEAFLALGRSVTWESQSVGVQAARERRTVVVRDADTRAGVGHMQPAYLAEGIRTVCAVPLVSQGRSVGVLGLYHADDHEWPDDELSLAQSFADQATVAINNAQLYRTLGEQAARMRSIHDLSARLNRLTDVQAIADAIVAEANALAAYHDIRVYRVDWMQRWCEPIAYTDRLLGEGDFRERLRVAIGDGSFTGWVAERGEPLLSNDALHDARGHTIDGTDDIEESMLVVPMLFEGRSVGVIALSRLGRNQFTTDDLQTMSIFAGYAAQAMANATAYERLEQQSAELARQLNSQRRLLEINERLLSTLDPVDVLDTIADGLLEVVRYDNLSIYRADPVKRQLVPVLARERHAEEVRNYVISFGRGLMGWAVDHAEPVLANDALSDPRAVQIPGTPPDPEALCVVPLLSEGEVIGCMNISRVGGAEIYFSDNDFELIKLFAGQASIALRNAEEHHLVSVRADTDALTGLGNHGAFQRTLAEVLDRPASRRRPVSLLMMDLDRFKAYNDALGHPAGDALLHAIGTAIYGAARSEDHVFRYGGDEFALVLPGVEGPGALAIAERVREAVSRLTAADSTPVSISVGVASYPADATDKNALIAAADTALYFGKQAGGDRLVPSSEVPREVRDLRSTLDQLARTALLHPEEAGAMGSLVEQAARLGSDGTDSSDAEATVRDALLAAARSMVTSDSAERGHADRVGRTAARVAEQLGCARDEIHTIELAARLQGLHALRSELEPVRSLRGVGQIARAQRLDLAADAAPLGSQVVSAVRAYDLLLTGEDGPRLGRAAAIARLRSGVGTRYRAEVIDALAAVVAARPHHGERRRRGDAARVERGAA